MSNITIVRPGQVWQDCDPRSSGRRITVVEVDREAGKAVVEGGTGRRTRIALTRFRPTKTGYRLVEDAGVNPNADIDALLAAVQDRIENDELVLRTIEGREVLATWRRSYDGVESDERSLCGFTLREVLLGVLQYEDDADRADAAQSA